MADEQPRTLVLLHCGWPRDRELIAALLRTAGAESLPTPPMSELRRLLAEERIDLVVADSKGGQGPLGELLWAIDLLPESRELPVLLLAEPEEMAELADLALRRPNAVVLTKPVEPMQLASAAQAGIRYWAGRRENRGLLRRLEGETRRYHDLVQGLDATVWEADAQTGRFTFVSRRAEELLGFPVERWLADPDFWAGRVHTDDREYAESGRRRGLREGRDFELEYRVIAADGRVTWIREAVRSVHDAANGLIGLRGLIWNITKRKKVERQLYTAKRELAEQLADMKHLHELSSRLSATLELEPTLEEILGAVMGVLGAVMGDLRLYDAERDELRLAASEGFTAEYLSLIDALPVGQGACGAAFARRERVVIEDVGSDPIYAPYVEAARLGGYQAVFSTPMVDRGGEVLGTIAAYFPEPHRPPERQARLVELYARQATDFVEHARRHRALREAIE